MENQLIQLYLRVCQTYDTCSNSCFQRLSNNSTPAFTDQELMTFFFFGHHHGLFQKKAIYKFTLNYWNQWFPNLPSYQTFCYRLNLLEQTFQALGGEWLSCMKAEITPDIDRVIDSFPVMLAKHGHAYTAKVAREIANTSYCAAKKTHFQVSDCTLLHSDVVDNSRCLNTSGCVPPVSMTSQVRASKTFICRPQVCLVIKHIRLLT